MEVGEAAAPKRKMSWSNENKSHTTVQVDVEGSFKNCRTESGSVFILFYKYIPKFNL